MLIFLCLLIWFAFNHKEHQVLHKEHKVICVVTLTYSQTTNLSTLQACGFALKSTLVLAQTVLNKSVFL